MPSQIKPILLFSDLFIYLFILVGNGNWKWFLPYNIYYSVLRKQEEYKKWKVGS